jgi:hypothetical protein
MTEAIAIPDNPSALVPWSQMDDERRSLLRQVCSGANLNDQQFQLLCEVGIRTGLDPFRKQIYGLVLGGKFTVFAGIDGFRAVARRNGLAGIDAPKFSWQDEKKTIPYACEVTVYRWGPNGQRESYTARGLLREYMGNTPIWKQRPCLMLAKCVEALAHRMAFTETMAQVYERDEFPSSDPTLNARIRQTERAPVSVASFLDTTATEAPALEADPDHDPTDRDAP